MTSLGLGPEPVAASGGNFWSSLSTIGTKVLTTVKTLAPAVQSAKTTIDAIKAKNNSSQPGTSPAASYVPAVINNNSPQPDADKGIGTGTVVLIGVGLASAIGGIIYLATANKGKALGCPCEEEKTVEAKAEVVSSELSGVKKRKRKK